MDSLLNYKNMEKSVFFGKSGLTSTEGNHLCNIAQEMIQSIVETLNNLKLYQVFISPISNSDRQLMSVGNEDISIVSKYLDICSQANSFCAWVREAIKTKETMLNTIDNYDFNTWLKENNIELPKTPIKPNAPKTVDETDIIESWSMDKRSKYLTLEAAAATYGKCIHPNGAFSNARKDAHQIANNPISTDGKGRDLILYYKQLTVPIDKIDSTFMELQSIYRSYEKELNALKAEIKETVNRRNSENKYTYQKELINYNAEVDKYSAKLAELQTQLNNWKIYEKEKIAKLKIVIPENLLEIYNRIVKQAE